MNLPETLNADFIDSQYEKWKADPNALPQDWQFFFKGFEMAGAHGPVPEAADDAERRIRVAALVERYRDLGHLLSCMDPLSACPTSHPLLALDAMGLEIEDLEESFSVPGLTGSHPLPLKKIIQKLKETYCHSIGVEYTHIQDPDERAWLQEQMEPFQNKTDLNGADKKALLKSLTRAALFEAFLNRKYVGVTRFSLEGGNALIPLLKTVVNKASEIGAREVILGMSHRGRLNVLANILEKPFDEIFAEFENCYDPDDLMGSGDVKYHNGYLSKIKTASGKMMEIHMVSNPSHLEAVDPVVEGIARARQDLTENNAHKSVLPLLIHGDAAFAGQGVVAETLNMSQLAGYRTGGTIHIIINNQIGYTTLPEDARSTRYSTDIAKMLMIPIFHVHGEDPEAVVHVSRLATDYRFRFGKDVVIDLVCYRRYGHNEGDEPYFTQPTMYERIRQRPVLNRVYGDRMIKENVVVQKDVDTMKTAINNALDATYDGIHDGTCSFPEHKFYRVWDKIRTTYSPEPVDTSVPAKALKRIAKKLAEIPSGFTLHPRLKTVLKKRLTAVETGKGIDWANAEALAFATLLEKKIPIRLSGQDVGRGTFSQRHSVLWDYKTGASHIPLNHLKDNAAQFEVYNSLLAEFGVLGFEYGYAVTRPEALTLWEAQFGDFANNAQSVFDLFIASGQAKWQQLCGLVILLPHGWEGLGPEHSSARLERHLQLCADDNIQVVNLTTPAQYFHMLQRQMLAPYRKPLIIMTPKSLLRHPQAVSELKDFTHGRFFPVMDEAENFKSAGKVVFCSGKIYYQLLERRNHLNTNDVAIVRLEQFYPFPETDLKTVIAPRKSVKTWLWVQEEPENMGAWQFIRPRLEKLTGKSLGFVGRKPASSPATGFPKIYKVEQEAIIDEAIGPDTHDQGFSG